MEILNLIEESLTLVRQLRQQLNENSLSYKQGMPSALHKEYMEGSAAAQEECRLLEIQLLKLQEEEQLRLLSEQ